MALFNFLRKTSPKDRFAKAVMERLQQRGWPHPVTYDEANFRIDLGGEVGALNLENLYRDWTTYPKSDQPAALDRALDTAFDLIAGDPNWEEAAPKLLPIIRNLADLCCVEWNIALNGGSPAILPHRSLTGSLVVAVALDRPSSLAYVSAGLLERWGRSFEEALSTAVSNLRQKPLAAFKKDRRGFYVSAFGDAFDASRVMTPEALSSLPIMGAPVAVVVSRDVLLVAGEGEPTAVAAMADFAWEAFNRETRPINYAAMVLRDAEWFLAKEPAIVQLNAEGQRVRDYAVQTELLETYLRHQGRPAAALQLIGVEIGGQTWTFSHWPQGGPVLLPACDFVVLEASEGSRIVRRWADVERICAPAQEPEVFPPRFRMDAWPEPSRWSELLQAEEPVEAPEVFRQLRA